MSNQPDDKTPLFESRLISVIRRLNNKALSIDQAAAELETFSGKKWSAKKLHFMSKGEGYARKWQLEVMIAFCLQRGWMPETLSDWMHITWTITGKKQSVEGGYNGDVYRRLADIADKPEFIFEQNYQRILEESYAKRHE